MWTRCCSATIRNRGIGLLIQIVALHPAHPASAAASPQTATKDRLRNSRGLTGTSEDFYSAVLVLRIFEPALTKADGAREHLQCDDARALIQIVAPHEVCCIRCCSSKPRTSVQS